MSAGTSWEDVKDVLYRALSLTPGEREQFLENACPRAHAMRAEIDSLLAANAQMLENFLQQSTAHDARGMPARGDRGEGDLAPGQFFEERFLLVRKLGEGGMGQVWLADQLAPVRRCVALKLIKAGRYDQAIANRFESERQSLAVMDHPSIAKIFEAGATATGQPYFVMEYVSGLPLVKYCDLHRLNVAQRLALFIDICDGVQHAHQKAVIHRDLKPANILVSQVDGKKCVPRIIDFGLAKATTAPRPDEDPLTEVGQFLGSPGYISPEQADPGTRDVDTRADVYSLGVVLYVLLTGVRPFDAEPGISPPLYEWLRKLQEDDPPDPSVKFGMLREKGIAIAAARGMEPKALRGLLRGDIDAITQKALARDRTHRYGSPSELGADLARYLRDEPVAARPSSALYRLRKHVRRHRLAVGVSALLLALLLAFAAQQTVDVQRLTRERDRVSRERERAVRVTDLLTGMFKADETGDGRGETVTGEEILDAAAVKLRTDFGLDPDARSQMMHLLARAYLNLGLYERAHNLAKEALDARLAAHGPDDARTLESMAQLGWIISHEGRNAQAERLERDALARERRTLGAENALTRETLHKLSLIVSGEGRAQEAEELTREWLQSMPRGSDSAPSPQ
jgi:eukaryotic-like serine/threonine-protein kinase